MSLKKNLIALAAIALISVPALSQTVAVATPTAPVVAPTTTQTTTTPARKLATQYSQFAGSQKNAEALIAGLRDDTSVTLVAGADSTNPAAPSATFTPATGKLGYGNINIALALAKEDLAKLGIANPTPEQLAAALNGGTVTTKTGSVTLNGVLAQRQNGMGWGQIANAMGVKLGSLVSASKTSKAGVKTTHVAMANSTPKANGAGKSGESRGGNGAGGGNGGGNGGGKK
jgi:hypothetical protein